MQAIDFIIDTLSHFVRAKEGPPPGIPATADPDFERELTWLCEWHALTPIVLASLEKLALRPRISRITLARIAALASASSSLTDDLLATAASLASQLEKGGIECLFLGGARLAGGVYPNARLRPVERIDALVREDDWPAVIERCQKEGFRLGPGNPLCRTGDDALAYYQHFAPCVLEDDKGERLSLRMRMFDLGETEGTEPAWDRGRKSARTGVGHVGPEDELIHSCLTYNMTDFGKLLHAVDIGLIVNRFRDDLDWDYVKERLESKSVYTAVFFTLSNVVHWLKLDRSAIGLESPGRVQKRVFDTLWHADYDSFAMRRPERVHRLRFYLFEVGRWREKLRFFAALMSPKPEWVAAFFDRPYRPWLKLKFVMLTFKNRVGLRLTGNP
jgi:hypothetical protein